MGGREGADARTGAPAAGPERRIERMRALGALRRSLRVTEGLEEVAAAAARFAREVLGCTHLVIYCAEKGEGDLQLMSEAPEARALPTVIERTDALPTQLEASSSVAGAALDEALRGTAGGALATALRAPPGVERAALALRASPEELIGVAFVAAETLDAELLDELVFDIESVLSARIITRLRAEELAVLEIQERELVGLLREVEERDAIIRRDLEQAREFQRQMLGAPPAIEGADVEVVYQPLGLVGGDLYAVSLEGDRLRVFIADATGHGVRASLTTMFIKSGYEAVWRSAPDPAALLAALNETIARTYKSSEMLFSAACVDIDLATGLVQTASAAHPPICVVRGGEARFVEAAGAFLGLRPGITFTMVETHIAPGDGVYLHTDGFVEARRGNELFGDDRFLEAVAAAHRRSEPAGRALVDTVTSFLDGAPFDDDGTFLGVRYHPARPLT